MQREGGERGDGPGIQGEILKIALVRMLSRDACWHNKATNTKCIDGIGTLHTGTCKCMSSDLRERWRTVIAIGITPCLFFTFTLEGWPIPASLELCFMRKSEVLSCMIVNFTFVEGNYSNKRKLDMFLKERFNRFSWGNNNFEFLLIMKFPSNVSFALFNFDFCSWKMSAVYFKKWF